MNREQQIEKVQRILYSDTTAIGPEILRATPLILDAILPQVTTVEEGAAVPWSAKLVSDDGLLFKVTISGQLIGLASRDRYDWQVALDNFGPLTVVWQP